MDEELKKEIERRMANGERASGSLSKLVRLLQREVYDQFIDWFDQSIDVQENRIKFSAKNLGRVQGVFSIFKKFGNAFRKKVLGEVLNETKTIVQQNEEYFSLFEKVPSIRDKARANVLLQWGYNTTTGKLLPGGYLETVFDSSNVGQKVASLVNEAISRNIGLGEFKKQFRESFIGKNGAGMVERRFNTAAFDLYQKIDRSANLIYADELGLNNAVYSGTIIKTTRPFCRARVNKIFNREQMEGWRELEWSGKPKIYNPFIDCGGHLCRHHLSWVSDEIAETIKARQQ